MDASKQALQKATHQTVPSAIQDTFAKQIVDRMTGATTRTARQREQETELDFGRIVVKGKEGGALCTCGHRRESHHKITRRCLDCDCPEFFEKRISAIRKDR